MATDPAKFTWHESERRYRDRFGRFVPRSDVRASLDAYLDNVVLEIRANTEALQDGRIEISEWQARMEASIKRGHTSAAAIAKGGWKQVGASDWGSTGKTIQFHYSKLRRFAMELEAGAYPMDGRLLNRAEMYGLGPTATYERILRAGDQAAGFRWERRILHSQSPCEQCVRYYDVDWQPIGTLPNIGEQCSCLTRCRCSFERSKSEAMPKPRKKSVFTLLSEYLQLAPKKKSAGKKPGGGGSRKGGGKANVGCGTGSGGFAKGNSCNRGGGGTGEKEGGPISHKAREDAKGESWVQYAKDGKTIESKKGLPAKINVESGPPRNAREQKLLERATKSGKDAIVRKLKKSAWTDKEGSQKHFNHGDERIATVLPTKDVAKVKPRMGDKPYDPSDHERTRTSKFTVVDHRGQISGHPSQAKADSVARSKVKEERRVLDKESEFKMVKDHKKSNLVADSVMGREPRALMTIRVLKPGGDGSAVEDLAVEPAGFDASKCDRRRRLAAIRDRVEAAPVTFHPAIPKAAVPRGARLMNRVGELPGDLASAMLCINGDAVGRDRKRLGPDDVYIHYIEAANSNFIGDRFMFLDATTLQNIAVRGELGIAFMNSHRTGGLSSPAELPYGRSFAGRYEEYRTGDDVFRRTLLGVYMLKGQYPNGTSGPSTDALHAAIASGTITDVSMGLNQGTAICDVCGSSLETGECKHVPGTHKGLTDDEREMQTARGVREGKASYTLFNAHPLEVSAVYKGAVPGAGFRKSLAFMDSPGFAGRFGAEVVAAYGPMLTGRQISKLQGKRTMPMDFASLFRFFQAADAAGALEGVDLSGTAVPGTKVVPSADLSADMGDAVAALAADRAKVEAQAADLATRERALDVAKFKADADQFAVSLKAANKATPFELTAIKAGYVLAALDDKHHPMVGLGDDMPTASRLQTFKDSHSQRSASDLTSEKVGDDPLPLPVVRPGETVLAGEADPNPNPEKPTAERIVQLCQSSEEGRVALAALAALAASKEKK